MIFKCLYSRWGRRTCKQINESAIKPILEVQHGKKSVFKVNVHNMWLCFFCNSTYLYFDFHSVGFPGGSDSKEFACNAGDMVSEGPWVRKIPLEKGMATHSNILAWRIPGGLLFNGSQRVEHDWATKYSTLLVNRSVCLFLLSTEIKLFLILALCSCIFVFLCSCIYFLHIFGTFGAFSSCREQRVGASQGL